MYVLRARRETAPSCFTGKKVGTRGIEKTEIRDNLQECPGSGVREKRMKADSKVRTEKRVSVEDLAFRHFPVLTPAQEKIHEGKRAGKQHRRQQDQGMKSYRVHGRWVLRQ